MDPLNPSKSPFEKETLKHFKELLLEKRWEALYEMRAKQDRIAELHEVESDDFTSINHHMGDVGTDIEEEEMNYELLERSQRYIHQIDDALNRIQKGTYCICSVRGIPIPKERLNIVLHTRYNIEVKNHPNRSAKRNSLSALTAQLPERAIPYVEQ